MENNTKNLILVTGGTGLVGSHLLYTLVSNDENVRAMYRDEKTLKRVKHVFSYFTDRVDRLFNAIDWVEADLNNIPQLQNAFNGVTYVYHCAALISFEPNAYKMLRKVNIKGTANIVNLCISNAVKKLCYVSSIATIGNMPNSKPLANEHTDWNTEADNNVYAITKYGAELEVWRGSQEGLDTIIVNPGLILGAGFWHGTGSGRLFKKIYKGISYYTNGNSGYVDVWDVVNGMVALMKSPLKNERFIFVAENLSFKDFQIKVANAFCIKPAKREAKPWLLGFAWRLDWLRYTLFGKRRILSKQLAKSITNVTTYNNSKIKKALGFKFKDIDVSINEVSTLFLKDIDACPLATNTSKRTHAK